MCSVNSVLNSNSLLLFFLSRNAANIFVLVGKNPAECKLKRDGKSFFEAKSPLAPKMTMDKPSWRTCKRDGSGMMCVYVYARSFVEFFFVCERIFYKTTI